ncbi:MAG: Uma2 family endonuclease [Acidobacteria bacterium]|nr:Uma2 family endonuclease [Acidobacteriota bacterium]
MSVQIERRTFSVDDYYRMVEVGLLAEGERVELIEGQVIKMSPIGSRHAACVTRLNMLFTRSVGRQAIVSVQNPVRLDEYNEPEPDVAVLGARADFYAAAHPTPPDVLLLVEVADTSVEYDRQVKVPLYARAGIAEVWLVDLTSDAVEIYAQPGEGAYLTTRRAARGESVASGLAGLSVLVDEVLG